MERWKGAKVVGGTKVEGEVGGRSKVGGRGGGEDEYIRTPNYTLLIIYIVL